MKGKLRFALIGLMTLALTAVSGCEKSAAVIDKPENASVFIGAELEDIGLPSEIAVKGFLRERTLPAEWVGDFDGSTPGVYSLAAECEGYSLTDAVVEVTVLPQYRVAAFDEYVYSAEASGDYALPESLPAVDCYGGDILVPVTWEVDGAELTLAGDYSFTPVVDSAYLCDSLPTAALHITPSSRVSSVSQPDGFTCRDNGEFAEFEFPVPVVADAYGNEYAMESCEWSCEGFDSSVAGTYVFLLVPDPALTFDCELPTLTVNIIPTVYVAPEGYYAPVYEARTFEYNDSPLVRDVMGVRVKLVQQMLGLTYSSVGKWGRYNKPTIDAVMAFQIKKGLPCTGDVDFSTWSALGLSGTVWQECDNYVTPVQITAESTRDEIIDVFMRTAESYVGSDFVYGACGQPKYGADCSGLVLQCMFSVGVYPDGLSPVQHTTEEYNSRLMWSDGKLPEVSREEMLVGDLVFYHDLDDESETVMHVAIYAGGDMCVEAYGASVGRFPVDKPEYAITGIKRVIAG